MNIRGAFFLVLVLLCQGVFSSYTSLFEYYLSVVKNKAESIIEGASGNTQCAKDLRTLIADLLYRKTWALEMIDASAKIQPGIISGNLYQVGNYDQCLKIKETTEEKNSTTIRGQYCTVILLPSSKFSSEYNFLLDSRMISDLTGVKKNYQTSQVMEYIKLSYGICIPASCSISNLQDIWNYVEHTFGLSVHAVFIDLMCDYEGKPNNPYDVDKYIYAFFTTYVVILLLSTLYDVIIHQREAGAEPKINIWTSFSLYTNFKKVFSYESQSIDEGYLTCINGIKVICFLWVMHGHRVAANVFLPNINGFYIFEWKKRLENMIVVSGSYAVDTFLALSGLLLTYAYLKYKVEKGRPISWSGFYIFRLLRLCPALLATILFYISILKNLNDGPVWATITRKLSASCLHTWWATLFFFTNNIDFNYQCVEHSWYLAVDSQLYFLSPIFLYNILKHPKRTITCSIILGIISAYYTFKITLDNEYGALYFESNKEYFSYIYQPTFVRVTPWLVGILFGYLIFQYPKVHIPKILNILLWASSISLMLFLIFIHLIFLTNDYDAMRSALYNSLARPAWAVAISLIVFSCVTGNGGVVNTFLSLPIFSVLVRLSYSMFLVHLAVIIYLVGGKRTYDHFSNLRFYHDFWGDFVFTFVAGTICCLSFELPFLTIGKLAHKKYVERMKNQKKAAVKTKKSGKKKYILCVYPYDGSEETFEKGKEFDKKLIKKIS